MLRVSMCRMQKLHSKAHSFRSKNAQNATLPPELKCGSNNSFNFFYMWFLRCTQTEWGLRTNFIDCILSLLPNCLRPFNNPLNWPAVKPAYYPILSQVLLRLRHLNQCLEAMHGWHKASPLVLSSSCTAVSNFLWRILYSHAIQHPKLVTTYYKTIIVNMSWQQRCYERGVAAHSRLYEGRRWT